MHARGLRLIGDITTNHTGDAPRVVPGPRADARRPERELYYFDDDDGDYESWLGVTSAAQAQLGQPELRRRFVDGRTRCCAAGCGAVRPGRLAGRRGQHDRPARRRRRTPTRWRALLRRRPRTTRPDALLVAEHCHDATGDLDRDGWHGT